MFREVLATRLARSFTFPCRIGEKGFFVRGDSLSLNGRNYRWSLAMSLLARRAEEALRKSEEKFAKAFQASPAIFSDRSHCRPAVH